jgi:outer membrane lipoprotein-sorting protein
MSGLWKKIANLLMVLMLTVSSAVVLSGCEEQGPIEEAAEDTEEAMEDAGDELEEAGE